MTAYDVGGRENLRPLYRHFYTKTDGFVLKGAREQLAKMCLEQVSPARLFQRRHLNHFCLTEWFRASSDIEVQELPISQGKSAWKVCGRAANDC